MPENSDIQNERIALWREWCAKDTNKDNYLWITILIKAIKITADCNLVVLKRDIDFAVRGFRTKFGRLMMREVSTGEVCRICEWRGGYEIDFYKREHANKKDKAKSILELSDNKIVLSKLADNERVILLHAHILLHVDNTEIADFVYNKIDSRFPHYKQKCVRKTIDDTIDESAGRLAWYTYKRWNRYYNETNDGKARMGPLLEPRFMRIWNAVYSYIPVGIGR